MIEIRETRDIQDVLQCVPFECQIRDKGRDPVPLKEMLYVTAQWFASDPDFHFFMFYEDGKVVGYLALKLVKDRKDRAIHIIRIYNGKAQGFWEAFANLMNAIKKAFNIDKITGLASNEMMKRYLKKRGFKEAYTMMERRF
jgi:hypothetical protein